MSDRLQEIQGTYGTSRNPCTVLVRLMPNGGAWYAVEGSGNVNETHDTDSLVDGVDVETLQDSDCFHWGPGIHSLEDLDNAVDA